MTPIGSRSGASMERFTLAGARRASFLAEAAQGGRDGDHLPAAEGLGEGVGDPVDRAPRPPRDEPQAPAVVMQLELAPVDAARLRGIFEDRRLAPGRALDAVVLADDTLRDDEPVGAPRLPALVPDRVDARLRACVARAVVAQGREVEREVR